MLDFARREPDCLLRRCAEGHFTASAWVLAPAGDRVLLVLHRKLGKWLQPGGHADGEADLEAVARREAREETGLDGLERLAPLPFDLDIHRIPARPGEPAHLHYDVRFLLRARAEGPLSLSDESHAVAWRALADIEALGEESLSRMARKTPAP